MTSGRFHSSGDSDGENSAIAATATTTVAATTNTITETSTVTTEATATTSTSNPPEYIRKFVFSSPQQNLNDSPTSSGGVIETLEIKIPELLQSGYSFYTWPCAPILAWFLWDRRRDLIGKRILELGAGTSLPGILAAKCGAQVLLSDSTILPKTLTHIRKVCLANNLVPGEHIQVIGLSWGLLLNSVFNIGPLDLLIASDCFYDPSVFEDVVVTVSFLLERNPSAKFLFTYQERSADWSLEALLKKWKLCAVQVNIDDIGQHSGVDKLELFGGHTIHLIEITKEL